MKVRTSFVTLVAGFALGLGLGGITQWTEYLDNAVPIDPNAVVLEMYDKLIIPQAKWILFQPAGMHYIICPDCLSMQRIFYNGLAHWQGALYYDVIATKIEREREKPITSEPETGPPEPDEPELDL
jgi:hypothetical protein